MLNFDNKYKDRSPAETVEIIHNFFINKGFNIEVGYLKETQCGTWGCYIALLMYEREVLVQNGKGATKEYALASGYAELFERYCNRIRPLTHIGMNKKFTNLNKSLNGYYLDKNEKMLTLDEILADEDVISLLRPFVTSEEQLGIFCKTICQNGFIGVPFKAYDSNNTRYFEPRLLNYITASTGMSAGNTEIEALIQGLAEIEERYVAEMLYKENLSTYYMLSKVPLSIEAKNQISKIEQSGNKFYLFDLSYNYPYPVICGVLFNKATNRHRISFSANPVFDIAVERVITELYQNIFSYDFSVNQIQIPFREFGWVASFNDGAARYSDGISFPEHLLLNNIIRVDDYNDKIFLPRSKTNLSNEQIMNHMAQLLQQQDANFYYYNNSPIAEMSSLYIFCPKLQLRFTTNAAYKYNTPEAKNNNFQAYLIHYEILKTLLSKPLEYYTIENMQLIYEQFKKACDLTSSTSINYLKKSDWFHPYAPFQNLTDQIIISFMQPGDLWVKYCSNLTQHFYTQHIQRLINYYRYLISDKYTVADIKKLFSFNTNESIELYKEPWYVFYKGFIEPFITEINTFEYNQIIKSYCW